MSVAVRTFRRRFVVGKHEVKLTVQLVAGNACGFEIEWNSDHPPRLSRADLAQYRKLRNLGLQSIANELGQTVAIADLDESGGVMITALEPETAP